MQVNRRRRNHGGTIIELEHVAHQGIVMAGLIQACPGYPDGQGTALCIGIAGINQDKPGDDIHGWFNEPSD